jgi:hypothetical protein
MAGVAGKGSTRLVDGEPVREQVRIVNGCVHVRIRSRAAPVEGIDGVYLRDGGGVRDLLKIVNGAVCVRIC